MDWLTARNRVIGSISFDRLETLLRQIDEHEVWGKYDPTEKLKVLAAIYESSKGDTPNQINNKVAARRR